MLAALLAGLVIGRVRGGQVSGLAQLAPRAMPLLVVGVLLITIARASVLPGGAARLLVVAGYLLALAGLAANLRRPVLLARERAGRGLWLVVAFAGAALNGLVVAANGGRMPVSPQALKAAAAGALLGGTTGPFYVLAGPHTPLSSLGDALPVLVGGAGVILSPGDILLAVGIMGAVQSGMLSANVST